MCGIAGILRFDGGAVDPDELESILAPLAHRGPDGSGRHLESAVALGHWRLSILDPSPAGAQPMRRNGTWLVHNGEIYNFLELGVELRDLGHHLTTGTDTEVILAAYEEWGLQAFERFNGMWALALWDEPRSRLVLSRDRFGVKPLFMRRSANELVFASEMASIVRSGAHPRGAWTPLPNPSTARDFLVRGLTDHSSQTFVAGVTTLPPGHALMIQPGDERLVRFWDQPPLGDDARPEVRGRDSRRDDELVEEFRALFDDSVRLRLRADVPIGSCLSGGLDSSAIVATFNRILHAGAEQGPDPATTRQMIPRYAFHARFPGLVDESRFAELAGGQAGLTMIYTSPGLPSPSETIEPVLRAQGEPFSSSSMYAQYKVMEAAHNTGLKVLLDGQGGDEVCGGYTSYMGVRVAGLVRAGMPIAAAGDLRGQVRRGSFGAASAIRGLARGLLSDDLNERVRRISGGRYAVRLSGELQTAETLRREHTTPGTRLARRLWQEISSDSLPALLRYEDRNSMAFGIETRVPFLDYRLVELAVRLPDRLRVNRGVTKVVLRRAMRGRVPGAILDRRDKMGFATPQMQWLGAGREHIAARVRGGQIVQRGWIEPREIERVLDDAARSERIGSQLWRVFILEEWLRTLWPGARG